MRMHFVSKLTSWAVAAACLFLVSACVWSSEAKAAEDDVKEFQAMIQKYLMIQKKAVSTVPPIGKEVTDPTVIGKHEKQVADAIRAARPGARMGDIFTPGVRRMITTTVRDKVAGKDGADAKATILGEGNPKSEAPATPIDLSINAPYPLSAPLSTVPPSVLTALPTLPKELEFRFVGRNLILRDTQANIIVDVIPNVF